MITYAQGTARCAAVVMVLLLAAATGHAQNLLLYDGESATTYAYGSLNSTNAFRGAGCYEAVPDAYHLPTINLSGLPCYRADISAYDEIWMYVKCDQTGKTFEFSVGGYPNKSNAINISGYIDGGALLTTYKLVRIPLSVLKTATYPLNKIEALYFGKAMPTTGHKLYIDEIWAVKTGAVDPATAPLVGSASAPNFGDTQVKTSSQKNLTVTNMGAGPLNVTTVAITGVDAADFTAPSTPFTIGAGQSYTVPITFRPSSFGEKAATVTLTHTVTLVGSTTTALLGGRGVGPEAKSSTSALDFGTVPVSKSVSWNFTVSNSGNQNLLISGASSTNPMFSTTPATLTIAPGTSGVFKTTFLPTAAGAASGKVSLATNDPNLPSIDVDVLGSAVASVSGAAELPVRVNEVTSSSVELAWGTYGGVNTFKVYFGPEPPSTRGAALPDAMLSATLPAETMMYRIPNLSAATDIFMRVEALTGTTLVATQNLHVRTVGGPREALDSAVREVHLFAPNIVQVILENKRVESYSTRSDVQDAGVDRLVNFTGPDYQAGPWTVTRRNGQTLNVTNVYRQSIPVGQPYYSVGYAAPDPLNLTDVDHLMYLVLDQPVGTRDVLHIQGPLGTDFYLPYSDKYLETPVLQVNQVGYNPRATERYAYVSGWMGDGGPLVLTSFPGAANVLREPSDPTDLRTNVVSNLPINLRMANDVPSGSEVRDINLATLPAAEGVTYRVQIPGVGVSWPTGVNEQGPFKAFYVTARGLYHNRWGRDLKPQWTDWSPRPPDHTTVYTAENSDPWAKFPETTPLTGERPLSGGHHDAGDFDVRQYHYSTAMMIMRAYELNKEAFTDGQLTIPESGNGIPDLLDEALYSVKAWEQLQEADGGVRMGAESSRHPLGTYFADEDQLNYWTYSRDPMHSLRAAAVMAQAGYLVAPFNATKSAELRDRAIRAFAWAEANGMTLEAQGPWLYATSELYRLTGSDEYKQKFEAGWVRFNAYNEGPPIINALPTASSYSDASQPTVCDYVLGYLTSPGANATYVSQAITRLTRTSNDICNLIANNWGHRNARALTVKPAWGEGTAVGWNLFRVYGRMQLGGLSAADQQKYFNAASISADYVLGCNALGMAWLTGLGSRHPNEPLHLDSLAFSKTGIGPMPGIPVYGPTGSLPDKVAYDYGANVYYPPYLQHPEYRRYGDIHTFVHNNEFDVSVQSAQAELLAMLIGKNMMPGPTLLPKGAVAKTLSAATLSAPAYVNAASVAVNYTGAVDPKGAGIKAVRLWVKKDTGAWTDSGLTQTAAAGSFMYALAGGVGRYYFDTVVENNVGETSPSPSGQGAANTLYDTTLPTGPTVTAPAYATASPIRVSYTGASDPAGVKLVHLWAKKDTGAWADTSVTAVGDSGSFDYAVTASGRYYFGVVVEDNAGNSSVAPSGSGSANTLLDTVAPTPGTPAVATYVKATPISVTFSGAADTGGSGLKNVQLWYKKDADAWTNAGLTATAASGTFSFTAPGGNGTYSFALTAVDNAGNASPVPTGTSACSTILDTTAPAGGTVTSPALTAASPITVSYTGAGDSGSGIKEVRLWVKKDSGSWTNTGLTSVTAAGSFNYVGMTGSAKYTFATQATDKAGNVSTAPGSGSTCVTTYDIVAPTVGTLTVPASTTTSPITVSYSGVADTGGAGLDVVQLWAKKGSTGTWQDTGLTKTTASGSFSYSGFSGEGAYSFALRAADKSGNLSAVPSGAGMGTTTFTTVFSPGIAAAPAYSKTTAIAVTFSGTSSTATSVALWYKLDTGAWTDSGMRATGASGSFAFTATTEGRYSFALRATDASGQLSAAPSGSGDCTTVYDATAPVAGKLTSPTYTKKLPFLVTYAGAGDTLSGLKTVHLWVKNGYGAPWVDTGLTSPGASGAFSFNTTVKAPIYYFYLQAEDMAGNLTVQPTDAIVFNLK